MRTNGRPPVSASRPRGLMEPARHGEGCRESSEVDNGGSGFSRTSLPDPYTACWKWGAGTSPRKTELADRFRVQDKFSLAIEDAAGNLERCGEKLQMWPEELRDAAV